MLFFEVNCFYEYQALEQMNITGTVFSGTMGYLLLSTPQAPPVFHLMLCNLPGLEKKKKKIASLTTKVTTLINWYYSVTVVTLHSREQIFSFWVTKSKKSLEYFHYWFLNYWDPKILVLATHEHVDSKALDSTFQKALLTWINT